MEAGGVSSMIHGFLQDLRFLASTLYLQRPERILALLMVMTVCWLIYAARSLRPVSFQGCGHDFRVFPCDAHPWGASVPTRQVDGARVLRV
jgi:hypothetical protein